MGRPADLGTNLVPGIDQAPDDNAAAGYLRASRHVRLRL